MIPPARPHRALVVALLLAHAGLLVHGIRRNFVTVDEVGHIPAGLSHWQTGTFSAYRVNPPLARMLAALPVLAARPRVDYRRLDESPVVRSEWFIGSDFAAANAGRYVDLVRLARLPGIAWSLLATGIIYRWSRELYGPAAGCLGVALWCFEPTVLAFAQVATPDIPATAAGLTATYAFWRYLKRPTWPMALACGLLLGIAELTKFTLLVLYATWPALWVLHRPSCPAGWGRRLAQAAAILVVSLLVINLGYGFRGAGRPLGQFRFSSRLLAGEGSGENRFRGSPLDALPVPVPADYLIGIDVQRVDFEAGLLSYLGGRWQQRGWWYYYLYALAVKLPLGLWGLVIGNAAIILAGRSAAGRRVEEWTLVLPALAILAFVSSQTGFSHHLRYVLPMFPFVVVSTSKLATFIRPWHRLLGPPIVALLAWSIAASLAIHPHSMSYFNELAGGPEHGHEHLVNSNIDWGQDLLFLKDWLDRHPKARPIGLAYFNNRVDPRIIGIEYDLPRPSPNGLFASDLDYQRGFGPKPGYYAVSVNFLRGMPFLAPDGRGCWPFVPSHSYEYFRLFRPIARAGFSIYIYRITPAEADIVRRRLGLPPLGIEAD